MIDLFKLVWALKDTKTGWFSVVTLIMAFANEHVAVVASYMSEAGFSVVLTVLATITAVLRMVTTEGVIEKSERKTNES